MPQITDFHSFISYDNLTWCEQLLTVRVNFSTNFAIYILLKLESGYGLEQTSGNPSATSIFNI